MKKVFLLVTASLFIGTLTSCIEDDGAYVSTEKENPIKATTESPTIPEDNSTDYGTTSVDESEVDTGGEDGETPVRPD